MSPVVSMESAVRAVHIGLWRGPDLGAEVQKGHTSSGVCRNQCCSMLLIFPGLLTLIMASDGRPDHWFRMRKTQNFQRWLRTKNLPVRKLKSGHGHKLNFVDGSLQFQLNSHHDLKHDGLAPSNAEHRHPTSDRVVWCFLAQCCTR